jgi:hypothetical protein
LTPHRTPRLSARIAPSLPSPTLPPTLHAQDAIRIAPNHAPLYRCWAIAEESIGNYAAARSVFADGLRADPQHAQLYHAWARMEGKLANLEGLAKLDEHARRHFGIPNIVGGGGAAGSGPPSPAPMLGRVVTDEMNEALPPQFRLDQFGMHGDEVGDDA